MNNIAYLVIEENSPELAVDNGNYSIIKSAVFTNYEDAYECAMTQIDEAQDWDFFPVDKCDETPEQHKDKNSVGLISYFTLYLNGNENSELWYEIQIVAVAVKD